MQSLNDIKKDIAQMSSACLKMWQVAFQSFMEHDLDLVTEALKEEDKINAFEKNITTVLVENGRSCDKKDKNQILLYTDIVADFELIGDYCKDILERVEIKIEEKLLFSDDAVKDYVDLYKVTEDIFIEIVDNIKNDNLQSLKNRLEDKKNIDSIIDGYRQRHNQRMISGVCQPLACNMFLNMLDFTAEIYRHLEKIAVNLLKINNG